VAAGTELVRLQDSTHSAAVAAAQAGVDAVRNRLAELVNGPRGEEILEARARAEGAASAAESESREFQRIEELVARKLTSQSALDRQRAIRDRARSEQKEAQARLEMLLRGTRMEELDQARDALRRAEAELERAKITLGRLVVRAPRAGTIEALPYKLGERPQAGAPVVVMLADGETYARVYVPGAIRTRVTAGAPAQVHVDGVEGELRGQVRYIAAEAAFTPYYALTQEDRGRLSYLAEITILDEQAPGLPVGIPVEVRFAPLATAER
jgi:HlyD family secretion protein